MSGPRPRPPPRPRPGRPRAGADRGRRAPAATDAGEPIVSHGISAFGDLKYPKDFAHFDYVNPDAPQGGTMSFRGTGGSQTFDSLNAFILKGEPAQGLGLLYDSLLAGSADEPDSVLRPDRREPRVPDGPQLGRSSTMRPEATFSDGVPITAEDVVFTYEVLMEKGEPFYQIMLQDIARVEALDPHRVKFTFKDGAAKRDLPQLAGGLSILPKHYYDTVEFGDSTLVPPVGSGAFVVADVQPGKSIKYCKNPDYWGKDLPVNVGTNNFDCIVYQYFADNTAAFEALKVGDYLFHEEFFSSLWATAYDFPAIQNGWVKRETIPDGRPSGTQGFWMNLRREKLQDPRVREAIALMFNFEWSNATLFDGLYERTTSFFQNSPMAAAGLPEGEELAVLEKYRDDLPPEIFTEPALRAAGQQARAHRPRRDPPGLEAPRRGRLDGRPRRPAQERQGRDADDRVRRRQPLLRAHHQPLRPEPAPDRHRRQLPPDRPRADAGAPEALRLRHHPRPPRHVAQPLDRAPHPLRLVRRRQPGHAQLVRRRRPGRRRADRGRHRLRQPPADGGPRPRPRPGAALEADLGAELVQGLLLGRLLGRLRPPRQRRRYSRGDSYWWFDQAKYDKLKAEGALR